MSITSFLSRSTCLSRHGSRDNLAFPFRNVFDGKNDNVAWLDDVVISALMISGFWSFQLVISKEVNSTIGDD